MVQQVELNCIAEVAERMKSLPSWVRSDGYRVHGAGSPNLWAWAAIIIARNKIAVETLFDLEAA
jgi:hypothetical protein